MLYCNILTSLTHFLCIFVDFQFLGLDSTFRVLWHMRGKPCHAYATLLPHFRFFAVSRSNSTLLVKWFSTLPSTAPASALRHVFQCGKHSAAPIVNDWPYEIASNSRKRNLMMICLFSVSSTRSMRLTRSSRLV